MTTVLDEAGESVASKSGVYAHPRENFRRIASLWQGWAEARWPDAMIHYNEFDVAMMLIHVKQARLIETPDHRDSIVDVAGYALTHSMVEESSDD